MKPLILYADGSFGCLNLPTNKNFLKKYACNKVQRLIPGAIIFCTLLEIDVEHPDPESEKGSKTIQINMLLGEADEHAPINIMATAITGAARFGTVILYEHIKGESDIFQNMLKNMDSEPQSSLITDVDFQTTEEELLSGIPNLEKEGRLGLPKCPAILDENGNPMGGM